MPICKCYFFSSQGHEKCSQAYLVSALLIGYCRGIKEILSAERQKGLTTSHVNIQLDPFAAKLMICTGYCTD